MRYPVELKNQAIEMAIEGNKSVAQVARDLDIKLNTLYGWVDKVSTKPSKPVSTHE